MVLLALLAPLAASDPAGASGVADTSPTTVPAAIPPAAAEVLVDLDTGRVLFGEHEHKLLPPASLTKMLTAMIATDWLQPGTVIPVTASVANVYPDKLGMQVGQHWPLNIVLHALLISSANDAAYALAERVGGSLEGFQPIMQEAAAQLGMSDGLILHDPAGLDGTEGVDGGNRISAWDLAIAARDLMANPTLASIVAMKTFWFTGPDGIVYELSSHNLAFLNTYPGAIGVKTGFTDAAGLCIAAAAVRDGRTMLAVVMNGESPDVTAGMLLNQGFATSVSAEGNDPELPPVLEPEPHRPIRELLPPPALTPSASPSAPAATGATKPDPPDDPLQAAAAAPTTLATTDHQADALESPRDTGGVAAGVLVIAGALLLWQVRGRRRGPAGAHSRRRYRR